MEVRVNAVALNKLVAEVHTSLLATSMRAYLAGPASSFLSQRAGERFSSQGDAASTKWKKLAESTQAYRAGTTNGGPYHPKVPINVRTGQKGNSASLRNVLVHRPNPEITAAASVYNMRWPGKGPRGFETKLKTAQQGKKSPATVPRPVAVIDEVDMVGLHAQLATHLTSQWT